MRSRESNLRLIAQILRSSTWKKWDVHNLRSPELRACAAVEVASQVERELIETVFNALLAQGDAGWLEYFR